MLFLLILHLNLLPSVLLSANFLGSVRIRRFPLAHLLNKLEHLSDAVVVLLQAADLLVQDGVLLVSHLEVLLQTLNVLLERMVLIGELRVEVLMEIQVALHVRHFTVPEVELTTLLLVVLIHK